MKNNNHYYHYHVFGLACGSTINLTSSSPSQIISSLDADNDDKYEPNLDCHWLILAPLSNTIKLTFTHMDIDNSTNSNTSCSCDYIKVSSEDIAKYYNNMWHILKWSVEGRGYTVAWTGSLCMWIPCRYCCMFITLTMQI